MTEIHTSFDTLLDTAHDLALTFVTGQLGPPIAGRMWIDDRSLDTILCPDHTERQVAMLIASGGSDGTMIHIGQRTLDAADLDRLAQNSAASGGVLTQGWLAELTPSMWLARHASTPQSGSAQTTLAAATAAGWPASCGDNPVLFLDDLPLHTLLAQADVGRTVTLLVGDVADSGASHAQPISTVPPDQTLPTRRTPVATGYIPNQAQSGKALPGDNAPRVVQEDAWEQPRNPQAPPPAAREPLVGDRVIIRQGRRPIPRLVNQIGTVVEIFRAPRDSCLVRIDGDPVSQREWFCYHDEIGLYSA